MNKKGLYFVISLVGLVLFISGILLITMLPAAQGIMQTLPYICIGVGCGVFGGSLGAAIKIHILTKNPKAARQAKIEQNDERMRAISFKAKAKAYDIMLMVFGTLMLSFALMQVSVYVILAFVAAYLFIVAINIYYLCKYQKEM